VSSCRFFTYYHPFIRVILHPSSPDDTYDQSHYLFWAICSIGARPRPEHPVPRARTGDLCVELGKEVKSLFCQILGERCRTHKAVQALILICEFPFARPQGRDGFIWVCRSRFTCTHPFLRVDLSSACRHTPEWYVEHFVYSPPRTSLRGPSSLNFASRVTSMLIFDNVLLLGNHNGPPDWHASPKICFRICSS
jgi:hypothetical protein